MGNVRPYRIVIEWSGEEDFHFRCDYAPSSLLQPENTEKGDEKQSFPVITGAMGNVLRKLRKEHISFPMFLVSIALNHRNLIQEIDRLLHLLHDHLENKRDAGTFSCFVSSKNRHE